MSRDRVRAESKAAISRLSPPLYIDMADSLSPQCTPLKHEYDSCFNVWFEEYLEPALATNATQKQRTAHYQRKADEFQAKCGKVYAEYQNCIQVGRFRFYWGYLLDFLCVV